MNKTLRIAGLLLVLTLLTVGFVSAEKVTDVAILPMPHVSEPDATVDGDVNSDEQQAQEATATVQDETVGPTDVVAEPSTEEAVGEDEAEPTAMDTALSFEQGWTEEELSALRELAQERIRTKEALAELEQLQGDVTEYLRELWQENVEPLISDMEARRGEKRPDREDLIESLDRWLERMALPKTHEMADGWDRLIERFAGSTGAAVEDAKDIGEEWLEQQRELVEDVLEELEELRADLRSTREEAADEGVASHSV